MARNKREGVVFTGPCEILGTASSLSFQNISGVMETRYVLDAKLDTKYELRPDIPKKTMYHTMDMSENPPIKFNLII